MLSRQTEASASKHGQARSPPPPTWTTPNKTPGSQVLALILLVTARQVSSDGPSSSLFPPPLPLFSFLLTLRVSDWNVTGASPQRPNQVCPTSNSFSVTAMINISFLSAYYTLGIESTQLRSHSPCSIFDKLAGEMPVVRKSLSTWSRKELTSDSTVPPLALSPFPPSPAYRRRP